MPQEERLITKILRTGQFRTVLAQKINRFSFKSPVNQAVFAYIDEHFRSPQTQGQVPTLDAVLDKFPTFDEEDSDAELETLCTELRNQRLSEKIVELMLSVQNTNEINPSKALNKLRAGVFSLARELEVSNIDSMADLDDVVDDYFRRKASKGLVGIPFPWPKFSRESGGLKPGELVVLFGRVKSMKTWLLLHIASHAFITGYKVLLVTTEMTKIQMKERLACLIGELDYSRFKYGQFDKDEEAKFLLYAQAVADEAEQGGPDIVIYSTMESGLDEVSAKVDEVKPDLVLIDSVYHLQQREWRQQSDLVTGLKKIAQEHEVPVVVTTQANRSDGEDYTRRVSFSDAYAQMADYMLHVEKMVGRHKDHPPGQTMLPILFVNIAASRDFVAEGFRLDVYPAVYIKEVETYDSVRAMKQAMDEVRNEDADSLSVLSRLADAHGWTGEIEE